jgi:hypothetical protein
MNHHKYEFWKEAVEGAEQVIIAPLIKDMLNELKWAYERIAELESFINGRFEK